MFNNAYNTESVAKRQNIWEPLIYNILKLEEEINKPYTYQHI